MSRFGQKDHKCITPPPTHQRNLAMKLCLQTRYTLEGADVESNAAAQQREGSGVDRDVQGDCVSV